MQIEGGREVRRSTKFYNLDMILAIDYRVRSNVGAQFRIWTSRVLTEYIEKGFVMNDERLKNPERFGSNSVILFRQKTRKVKRNFNISE